MNQAVVDVSGVGKSFRTFATHWGRVQGWLFGTPGHFTEHWVLRDVSFRVNRGESIGILGRNGAGKTTLLRMIAGIVTPSEGVISRRGRINAILELGLGINSEFTARQNVLHACGLLGYGRKEIAEAMPEIEHFADIGAYFDEPARMLSSGMQMRVAFAAATAFQPDILVVDEALAVGDVSFQAKCFERIAALRRAGSSLLFVSHSVSEVVKHCERALFIRHGRLALDGDARDVSNVYLEDMFGKGGPPRSAMAGAAPAMGTSYQNAPVASFDSRPFYRKEEHRWGTGGAAIIDYRVEADGESFPATLRTHQSVRITFVVDFERDVQRPVYGLLIRSVEGIFLYGTNSLLATGRHAEPASAGSRRVAMFEFRMMLNAGTYLVSLGVSDEEENGELVPLDRRYDALLVPVAHAREGGPGLTDLDARFELLQPAANV